MYCTPCTPCSHRPKLLACTVPMPPAAEWSCCPQRASCLPPGPHFTATQWGGCSQPMPVQHGSGGRKQHPLSAGRPRDPAHHDREVRRASSRQRVMATRGTNNLPLSQLVAHIMPAGVCVYMIPQQLVCAAHKRKAGVTSLQCCAPVVALRRRHDAGVGAGGGCCSCLAMMSSSSPGSPPVLKGLGRQTPAGAASWPPQWTPPGCCC